MASFSKLTRIEIEDLALDFMVRRWESQHRAEVRTLVEMLEWTDKNTWGAFPEELTPADFRAGEGGTAGAAVYRGKHAISEAELASARGDFQAINGSAAIELANGLMHLVGASHLR